MRVGFNPNKDKEITKSDFFHQIIIPVYIPQLDGYFKDSFKILRWSLESLYKTTHSKTYFSVIDNGSCAEIGSYLNQLKMDGKIHELIQTTAIGKLNAIFKGLSGHKFQLITITDSDVLFGNGWQQESYRVFENFPEAGAVSPAPSSKLLFYHTENIIGKYLLSTKLKFTSVKNPAGLQAFADSIGNPQFYNTAHLEKYLTIERSGLKAVVGAGHFVCTYRGEVFWNRNKNFSNYNMGGDSEGIFLDKAVTNKGLWRLSTESTGADHMGNVAEIWMEDLLSKLPKNNSDELVSLVNVKKVGFKIRNKLFQKLIANKKFRFYFYRYKGLTNEQAAIY